MCRAISPLPGLRDASSGSVATWSASTKLVEAARRATPKLPAESRAQFAALFSPTNIEITAGVLTLWGASHFCGVGEAADLVLLGIGVLSLGTAAFGVARSIGKFLSLAVEARTEADLDRAATYLADAVVTIGVMAFIALIMKAGSRLAGRARLSSRAALSGEAELELDLLTEEVLQQVFGSTKNIGKLPRQNVRIIVQFFKRLNVENGDPEKWANLIKGIDLHAPEPVKVITFQPGELVGEYVELSRPPGRQIGQWMVRLQGGISHRNLGLSGAGRAWKVFRVTRSAEVLESRAAPAADYWTTEGTKPHTAVALKGGHRVLEQAEQVAGGGKQFFMPRAWEFLEEAP